MTTVRGSGEKPSEPVLKVDVLIVGAGLSGIGAACHLQHLFRYLPQQPGYNKGLRGAGIDRGPNYYGRAFETGSPTPA